MTDLSKKAKDAIKRMNEVRNFPDGTDGCSRHTAMIAEQLADGKLDAMLTDEPEHCAISLALTVAMLWEARAALDIAEAEKRAAVAAAVDELSTYLVKTAENYYTKAGEAQGAVRTFASAIPEWAEDFADTDALAEYAEKVRAEERERLGPLGDILFDAVRAAHKAMQKFPQPNYVISKWAEETGEVTKAAIHFAERRETIENVRGEIVQALAMLHRMMVEGDEVHNMPPLAAAIRGEEE
jgi:hypothetical protein